MANVPQSPQELYDGWVRNLKQEVWVIDETKYELPPTEKEHGELIAFTIVRLNADEVTDHMQHIEDARNGMPPAIRQKSFKSGELWRATQPSTTRHAVAHFANAVAGTLMKCKHIVLLLTTHKHLREDPHTGRITSIAEDGTSRVNESKQLLIVYNLVLHLMENWSISKPVDVLIDRSWAFGLDPRQEGISKNQLRMHYGALKTGTPEVRLIAGDDQGVTFRDVLLLPDFLGYIVRECRANIIDPVLPAVLSGQAPFYQVPLDLPAMIAAVKAGRPSTPSRDDIAQVAYFRWLDRGGGHGRDQEDWFAAEKSLRR